MRKKQLTPQILTAAAKHPDYSEIMKRLASEQRIREVLEKKKPDFTLTTKNHSPERTCNFYVISVVELLWKEEREIPVGCLEPRVTLLEVYHGMKSSKFQGVPFEFCDLASKHCCEQGIDVVILPQKSIDELSQGTDFVTFDSVFKGTKKDHCGYAARTTVVASAKILVSRVE